MTSHDDQKEYLITLDLLQTICKHGDQITKIQRVDKFKQGYIFKEYIEKNI